MQVNDDSNKDDIKLQVEKLRRQLEENYNSKNIEAYINTCNIISDKKLAIKHSFSIDKYTTNLLIENLKNSNFTNAKFLVKNYADIVDNISEYISKSDVIANALVLAILTKDNDIEKYIMKLLPENFDDTDIINPLLAFNLACFYAVKKEKEKMCLYVNLAIDLGKKKEEFINDSDFKEYLDDKEFQNALIIDEDIDKALLQLRDVIKQYPDYTIENLGLINGSLYLNVKEKSRRQDEYERWKLKNIITGWFPEQTQDFTKKAVRLLANIFYNKINIFPKLDKYFSEIILYNNDLETHIDDIQKRFSTTGILASKYYNSIIKKDIKNAFALLEQIEEIRPNTGWKTNIHLNDSYWPLPLLKAGIKYPQLVNKLIQMGADLKKATTWTNDPEILNILINAGAPLDISADALIGSASEDYNVYKTIFLLSNGANVNAKNEKGQTALMRACGNGNVKTVYVLLAHKAKIDNEDKDLLDYNQREAENLIEKSKGIIKKMLIDTRSGKLSSPDFYNIKGLSKSLS